jgi:L-asparaginase II
MAQLGERVFCKIGAEGVYCASFPELGLGVALKIDDGTARGAEVAMAALIESLLPLGDADQLFMRTLSTPELKNWNGINVGSMRASAALRRAAAR